MSIAARSDTGAGSSELCSLPPSNHGNFTLALHVLSSQSLSLDFRLRTAPTKGAGQYSCCARLFNEAKCWKPHDFTCKFRNPRNHLIIVCVTVDTISIAAIVHGCPLFLHIATYKTKRCRGCVLKNTCHGDHSLTVLAWFLPYPGGGAVDTNFAFPSLTRLLVRLVRVCL